MVLKLLLLRAVTELKQSYGERAKHPCQERERLSDALLAAIRHLMELQTEQTSAIISNEQDFSRFDDLIHIAQSAKSDAKYALIAHIQEHQCE